MSLDPGSFGRSGVPSEVQRRLLRSILREEREKVPLTQREAAERVLWSLSKLIRIETGVVPVSPADARVLLLEYGVSPERLTEVVELAVSARRPDEFARFRNAVSSAFLTLCANERAADFVQQHEPFLVPGLFQTEEYARALLKAWNIAPERIDLIWELRRKRQKIIGDKLQPEFFVVIGEASIRTPVGGHDVMVQQVARLKELAELDRIFLSVLPFRNGPIDGMNKAFTVLAFRNPSLADLLYVEDQDDETVERDVEVVIHRYQNRFVSLQNHSLGGEDFAAELDAMVSA